MLKRFWKYRIIDVVMWINGFIVIYGIMKYIIDEKMFGLRMKGERDFIENYIGCRARWYRVFRIDEYM